MAKVLYDKNVDYQAKINEAVKQGNYQSAAIYEQQRNAKIADMNAAGTNTGGFKASNNWQSYAPGTASSARNSAPRAYKSTGNVSTNSSYNGSYLNVNLDTDYQAKINEALAKGDYYSAAQNEALRNAKINYLNSINDNPTGYKTTNNYVSNYSSNNKGGQAYGNIWTYDDLKNGNLPDNWTKANIGGLRYKRDPNTGAMYNYTGTSNGVDNYRMIGNGFNPDTGERIFTNYDDAKQYAYDDYRSATGDYTGTLSDDYIKRIQNGTFDQYNRQLVDTMMANTRPNRTIDRSDIENERRQRYALIQAQQALNNNDGWYQNRQGAIDIANDYINNANISPDQREVLHTNSFETDPTLPDDYHIYGVRNYSDPYYAYIQDMYRRGRYTSR